MSEERGEHRPWPLGLVVVAIVGGACGWLAEALGRGSGGGGWSLTTDPVSLGLASAFAGAGLAFAWTLERQRWSWTLLFAIGTAAVFLTIFYWNGSPMTGGGDVQWRVVALLLAFAACLPLFQAMRDEGRWRFPYVAVHWYAWTDLAAAIAVGLLIYLAASAGLGRSAAWENRLTWAASGAALALAIGLARTAAASFDLQLPLRRLLGLLAPLTVIAVLGLPIIAARVGSLAAACLLLALASILVLNAVLGNGPEQQTSIRLLRLSAVALGALLLPLGLVAGAALWIRMGEHGYTPDRLWAAVFALAVVAIAIRYLTALVRRRRLWAEPVRRNNVRVLGALFLFGLLLATPVASFSSFATRDQMARLREGRLSAAEFDWQALRFDFGRAGVRALEEVREGVDTAPEVRTLAARALLAEERSQAPAPEPRRP